MASATVGSLAALQGNDAGGLSATNISRLTNEWETEYRAFQKRSLADRDYVYVWVDGVHFNVRLQDDRLCTLVMIGVRPDGTKELITVEDGYRESAESWKTVLRDLKRRGRGQCIRPLWRARAPRVFKARVSNSPPAHPARASRHHGEAALTKDAHHRSILSEHESMKGTQTILARAIAAKCRRSTAPIPSRW